MQELNSSTNQAASRPVALVTGGARRLGAAIVRCLHQSGMDVLIHYHQSQQAANELAAGLNREVADSAVLLRQDLRDADACEKLLAAAAVARPQLAAVVHNASVFPPSSLQQYQQQDWADVSALHLHTPMALARHAAPMLQDSHGSMVYITDIYARHPRASHSLYCASKAGLDMLVRCLAQQLAPRVRVNAVAPGAILWAEQQDMEEDKEAIINSIPMGRRGEPQDIAMAVRFLLQQASYMTGATISVDGGRKLNLL